MVAASCSIQNVRNVRDQIKEISFFFKVSEPRQKNARPFPRKPCSRLLEEEIKKYLLHKMGRADHRVGLYISNAFWLEPRGVNEGMVCNRETSTEASSIDNFGFY